MPVREVGCGRSDVSSQAVSKMAIVARATNADVLKFFKTRASAEFPCTREKCQRLRVPTGASSAAFATNIERAALEQPRRSSAPESPLGVWRRRANGRAQRAQAFDTGCAVLFRVRRAVCLLRLRLVRGQTLPFDKVAGSKSSFRYHQPRLWRGFHSQGD